MQWWNDFLSWTGSTSGWRVLSGAIIPFVAIVLAGLIAALIGRAATKRAVDMHDREARNAAVATVLSAARKAANWGNLGHDERAYADHLAEDADIRLRLLPIAGAVVAANWAQHEIADIKKNSSTFSFQAEQSLAEFRDRMLEWQMRPAKARKLFRADLERWKFESPDPDHDLIRRQQQWNADQKRTGGAPDSPRTTPEARPTPSSPSAATPALKQPQPLSPAASNGNARFEGTAIGQTANAEHDPSSDSGSDRSVGLPTAAPLPPVTGALTEPKGDAAAVVPTTTSSVPTRIEQGNVEPADPHETDESPYAHPVSASELRRRAEEDDDL
ncbi:hypothetical protein [Curtobacterium ammoniigenes]|uniref:hypothetical protein n=1 Tax=Curtobacterium ammoniigenes TaxID=395387 RepID=UPI0012ED14D4|nr:hypothetical protein [Curtobacterium ammoniigenes]